MVYPGLCSSPGPSGGGYPPGVADGEGFVIRARITGVGSYLPPRVVTNDELAKLMDTTDEWIVQRTGIRERHWVEGRSRPRTWRWRRRGALAAAGVKKEDMDMIFLATLSPDHEFPGTACFFQAKMGMPAFPPSTCASSAPASCTRWPSPTSSSAPASPGRCWWWAPRSTPRASTSRRGGGIWPCCSATAPGRWCCEAVRLRRGPGILCTHLHATAPGPPTCGARPGHGLRALHVDETPRARLHFPQMNGRTVFMHAVKRMAEAVMEALDGQRA